VTTTNKRRQRNRENAAAAAPQPAPKLPFELQPMPDWKWATLPVFFMFSLGAMIGLQVGVVAGYADSSGLFLAASAVVALMLALGFSRLMTRFLLSRNWIKPRPKRR
jgi:hypothetical protein